MTKLKKFVSLLLVSLLLCSCASSGILKKIENKVFDGDGGAQLVIVKEKFKSPKLMFHGPSLIKPNTNPEEIEKYGIIVSIILFRRRNFTSAIRCFVVSAPSFASPSSNGIEWNHQIGFRMISSDGISYIFHKNSLTCLRLCYYQRTLSFSYWREKVYNTCR